VKPYGYHNLQNGGVDRMITMRVRYGLQDVNLKISNVNPPEHESYVLLTAADEDNNEISFALSHEQAELLENELFEANRRWKMTSSIPRVEKMNEPYVETEPMQH
jgi:hypothetical protein